ncbi:MAG TPA: HAD-IB family hydrolase [Cyclobacteriaceae bacterium]|nr:HAD-IB family hydrolase [Cyclobacteriaceae bacterium]
MKKSLALFDFDGTITTKDTFLEFIKFYHGKTKFILGFLILSPIMVMMILKLIPNWRGKEIVLTWFFKGEDLNHFNQQAEKFCSQIVPSLLRPQALTELEKYKQNSTTVLVVSASAQNWVEPWCKSIGVECLATKLEVKSSKLTGKLQGKNCFGEEKVVRIKERLDLSTFEKIAAYGDSSGDTQMLAIATEKFYKPFRTI